MLEMMILRRRILLRAVSVLAILTVAGCARVYDQTTTANAMRGANAGRDPAGVELVTGEPNRRYQSLGQIRTQVRPLNVFSPTPTNADVNDALRREAARLGADAVINVRYGDSGPDALGVVGVIVGGPLTPASQSNGTGQAVMWLP